MEEITAEYAVQELAPMPGLQARIAVTVACKTDLGRVRENNEDKFEYFMPEDERTLATRGQIFLVCDGMGGHAAGQIASELTAKTFIDVYLHHPSNDPRIAMEAGINAANRFVLDVGRAIPARRGMGTTLSGLILLQGGGFVIQVGDSRVYRMRDGILTQLTEDHTWVNEAIRAGMITAVEAETHPHRHVLTRAVGTEGDIRPDISTVDIREGDLYLLCSDGLMNHVADELIAQLLGDSAPSQAAWNLVGAALQGGGSDNTTVLIVRIDQISEIG